MIDGVTILGVATAFAALIGPIAAVWITRRSDDRKEIRARRMEIFRTLMRTRKMPIHFEHVGALNLIEVEFVNDPGVIKAWKAYLKNLSEPIETSSNNQVQNRARQDRRNLLTKLIHEISIVLKFDVQQLDILEGSYLPQGWDDDDWEQKVLRKALIDMLDGHRPILVQSFTPGQNNGPYPPAPELPDPNP